MALNITDVSYHGKWAGHYWRPNVFRANSIEQGVINVIDGVHKSVTIGNLSFTGGLQPRVAKPVQQSGTWGIGATVITPQDAMLYTEFNPRDLEVHWETVNQGTYLIERQLPQTFESYILSYMTQKVFGEQMETGYWMGSTTYNVLTDPNDPRYTMQFTDGIMKRLVGASDVMVDPSPSTITASNIFTKIETLLGLITTNKKGLITMYDRLKIAMSPKTNQYFRQAMQNLTFKGVDPTVKAPNNYANYNVLVCNGMPDDTLVIGEFAGDLDSAFHVAYNSTGDENMLQLARTRPQDETYFIKALLKFDMGIKYTNEIAMHTLLTSSYWTVS